MGLNLCGRIKVLLHNFRDNAYQHGLDEGFESGYGQGYDEGKEKAHFEVRHWQPGLHAGDCGCNPCKTVRAILAGLVSRLLAQALDENHTKEAPGHD